jgi:hypothetical protein
MTINPEGAGEYVGAAGKAVPPIAVSTAAIAGLSLQDWVLIATLAYTLLQIALLIRKFLREQDRG